MSLEEIKACLEELETEKVSFVKISFVFEFYALIPFLSVPNFDVVFVCQENELSPLQQSGLKQARMMLESMAEVTLDLKVWQLAANRYRKLPLISPGLTSS